MGPEKPWSCAEIKQKWDRPVRPCHYENKCTQITPPSRNGRSSLGSQVGFVENHNVSGLAANSLHVVPHANPNVWHLSDLKLGKIKSWGLFLLNYHCDANPSHIYMRWRTSACSTSSSTTEQSPISPTSPSMRSSLCRMFSYSMYSYDKQPRNTAQHSVFSLSSIKFDLSRNTPGTNNEWRNTQQPICQLTCDKGSVTERKETNQSTTSCSKKHIFYNVLWLFIKYPYSLSPNPLSIGPHKRWRHPTRWRLCSAQSRLPCNTLIYLQTPREFERAKTRLGHLSERPSSAKESIWPRNTQFTDLKKKKKISRIYGLPTVFSLFPMVCQKAWLHSDVWSVSPAAPTPALVGQAADLSLGIYLCYLQTPHVLVIGWVQCGFFISRKHPHTTQHVLLSVTPSHPVALAWSKFSRTRFGSATPLLTGFGIYQCWSELTGDD